MKLIHTMYDNQLNIPYKLYQVSAKVVSERLHKDYGLDKVAIQMFNSDSGIGDSMIELARMRKEGHYKSDDNYYTQKIKESIAKIENNEHVSEINQIGISFGYELMPIAVSVRGDFEDEDTKLELIDGFKRMFCMNEVPDIPILVKVYGVMNDVQWINAMILYNSWKFVSGEGAGKYMDRGFQFGLSYRYDIRFVEMIMEWGNMNDAINLYTSGRDLEHFTTDRYAKGGVYYTFWNNDCFAKDIVSLYDILNYKPVFTLRKKGKADEVIDTAEGFRGWGLKRVLEVFVTLLGEVRRKEWEVGLTERKPFDMAILTNYLSDPEIEKQMVKLCKMTVDGHIINYIQANMREDIKERFYAAMGHEYKRAAKEKKLPNEDPKKFIWETAKI